MSMRHRGRHRVRTAALPRDRQLGARLGQRVLDRADLKLLLLFTLKGRLARLCRAGREICVREIRCICVREIAVSHARHSGGVARAAQLACGAQQRQRCALSVMVSWRPSSPASSASIRRPTLRSSRRSSISSTLLAGEKLATSHRL